MPTCPYWNMFGEIKEKASWDFILFFFKLNQIQG